MNRRLQLDQPINIHLTGCPNSCAQHYVGDIGLQGVKVNLSGASVEGYNSCLAVARGGRGDRQTSVHWHRVQRNPGLLERVLKTYLARRQRGESFAAFTRRHEVRQLQEMFSE